jgi:hypothetical protein
MKGVKRFGIKEKFAPHYIGPFPILEKCGSVAYKLELLPSLAGVHDIFHASQLKKCLKAPVDVVLPEVTPLEVDLTYPKHPVKILDQKDHVKRRKMIKFFKIQWSNHIEEEATWEMKTSSTRVTRSLHCHSEGSCHYSLSLLGHSPSKSRVEIYCYGGGL